MLFVKQYLTVVEQMGRLLLLETVFLVEEQPTEKNKSRSVLKGTTKTVEKPLFEILLEVMTVVQRWLSHHQMLFLKSMKTKQLRA